MSARVSAAGGGRRLAPVALWAAGAWAVTLWAAPAWAGAPDMQAVPHGDTVGCAMCHTDRDDLNQINDFARAFAAAGRTWGPALAAGDADGDGRSNGEELQDPEGAWRPGDPPPGDAAAVTPPGEASAANTPDAGPPPADGGPPPAECPAVPVGAPCADDPDCGAGGVCFRGVGGGYCTVVGPEPCCPAGSTALPALDLCVRRCTTAADCPAREGRRCEGSAYCWGCRVGDGAASGQACAGHDDCGADATCVTTWGADGPAIEGGVCALDSPHFCCPPGTQAVPAGTVAWCLPACRQDSDCAREGWGCDHAQGGVCWPGAMAPPVDAGAPQADGGAADAGVAQDAAPSPDAAPGRPDAAPGGSGSTDDGGCGCDLAGRGAPPAAWVLGLLLLGLRRRRRR